MDIWTTLYILGFVSITFFASLHVFVRIFDSLKHGKKIFAVILVLCLIVILTGIIGSLATF